jgi:pimeloyl-ACP methyl ester carboxylesterase
VRTGLSVFLIFSGLALGGDTQLLFDPTSPDVGPFPSDVLTIAKPQQKTGRQINLPMPQNCGATPAPTACSDAAMLNELDGFSVEPRIRLCFSQPVRSSTIADGVFLIGLHRPTQLIRIGRIFVDPATNCVAAKPESTLEPGKRYVMFITDHIRDASGRPVIPSREFKDSLKLGLGSYGNVVDPLLNLVGSLFGNHIVGASLFTTLSATDWIHKARAFVNSGPPPVLAPMKTLELSSQSLTSFRWLAEVKEGAPLVAIADLPRDLPGVDKVSFGLFPSPNFLGITGSIPQTPTGNEIVPPIPQFVPISFHVFLPLAARTTKVPVAIYGHGLGDNQFGATTTIASTLAQAGIATIGVEIVGHGFGSKSVVEVTAAGSSTPEQILTPGRGITLPKNESIGPVDGCILPGPLAARDCARQTAVDIFALVRAITESPELNRQLDASRIYFIGQSFGSIVGSMVASTEPRIRASVLNVPAGSAVDTVRLARDRSLALFYLGMRNPPLLNVPPADFNDNYVFRGTTVVNNVPGAPEIQAAFEVADWLNMPAGPLAFASGLKRAPVLFQFAKGDEEVPNPTNSAIIRAAGGQGASRYLLFDRAKEIAGRCQLPSQPHRFLANPEISLTPASLSIAIAAQKQVAGFFNSNGSVIPDANSFLEYPFRGRRLFETPSKLPEELNFDRSVTVPVCP